MHDDNPSLTRTRDVLERAAGEAAQARRRAEAARAAREVRTPQGTMLIVLLYGAALVIVWAYLYYVMLRSEAIPGGS